MKFRHVTLEQCPVESDAVIVIDVCRAFTTAAFALSAGADRIFLVKSTQEAFDLRQQNPEWLLVGEEGGLPIPGFDHWNSPFEIESLSLKGKTLVLRTSSGTQGVVRCQGVNLLMASSFVVAAATAQYVRRNSPNSVSFVVTGVRSDRSGAEDIACAEYLQALLQEDNQPADPYIQQAESWDPGLISSEPEVLRHLDQDRRRCLQANIFNFPLLVSEREGRPVLSRII
jgi:2-phosphosulfolactate phosphatase